MYIPGFTNTLQGSAQATAQQPTFTPQAQQQTATAAAPLPAGALQLTGGQRQLLTALAGGTRPLSDAQRQELLTMAGAPGVTGGQQLTDAERQQLLEMAGATSWTQPGTNNRRGRPTKGIDPLSVTFQTQGDQAGLQFVTNRGRVAGIREKEVGEKGGAGAANPTGFVPLVPDAQYRIRNESGKDSILYTGTGEEGLRNVYSIAQNLSAEMGKKANWGVEMLDPATGQWRRVADDDPAKNTLGKIAGMALPIATAFIPGLNVLGTIAAGSLAGGVGSKLAGGKFLQGALMGGLSAAGGSLLGPAIQGTAGAAGRTVATNLGRAVGTGVGTTVGGLATGQNLQNSLLGGVTAGGLSYAGGELFGPKNTQNYSDLSTVPDWVVGAGNTPLVGGANVSVPDFGAGMGALGAGGGGGDIVVTRMRAPAVNTGALSGAAGNIASNATQQHSQDGEDIVVTRNKLQPTPNLGSVVPGLTELLTPQQQAAINEATKDMTPEQKKKLGLSDYLRLAGLGLGLLDGLLGGGGKIGSPGKIPGGLSGGLNPVFGGGLPAPSLPGLSGATAGPRTAADLAGQGLRTPQDYYRYGYGPEQSFFKGVPQGAPNTSTAFTGYETPFKGIERMAEGGYVEDEERIAAQELAALRDYEGEREYRRRPRFSTQHSFGGDDFSNYSLAVPVGDRAELLLNAFGRGLIPEEVLLGGSYDLGDGMRARASHMLGGGTDYGLSVPFLGGDLDIGASAPRGFVPKGVRASYSKRFEEGGYAVGGEGDGRDDKVPALLSDGEYVMDAETVAMLGNGSSKAGAEALDKFRVNIRKHKGRELSRGSFSAKAKRPEQYLKKGRV